MLNVNTMITNPVSDLLLYDLNSIDSSKAYMLISNYLMHIIKNKKLKIFTGISKEYSKYIGDFRKILKLNSFTTSCIETPLEMEDCQNYTCFFVFQDYKMHAFGSFQDAYLYASFEYLNSIILFEDEIIKDLSNHTNVYFGQVLIKNDEIIYKDVVSVVNKNFYAL